MSAQAEPRVASAGQSEVLACSYRHLRFGWWTLLTFLSLGLVLEGLHGFKIGWYLDVSNASRRLMWTLAHTHGTLIALINLAFGSTVPKLPAWSAFARRLASWLLIAAGLTRPLGFFLGGLSIHGGDPGLGIVLVALGGLLLFVGVLLTARGCRTLRLPAASTAQKVSGRRKRSR